MVGMAEPNPYESPREVNTCKPVAGPSIFQRVDHFARRKPLQYAGAILVLLVIAAMAGAIVVPVLWLLDTFNLRK
jgi:hypothetical protein